jgi:hypothetical protein
MQRALRAGGFAAVVAVVGLAARTLAYALAPDPRAEALGRLTGGPRPIVVGGIAVGLAGLFAGAVLWLSALGVRERHRLQPVGDAPRLRIAAILVRAGAISVASATAFTAIESAIHVREGLGFHGLHCLIGPVHQDAVPLIVAFSLAAAALVEAVRHAVAFARRVVAARPPRCRVPGERGTRALIAAAPRRSGFEMLGAPTGRGPPAPSFR